MIDLLLLKSPEEFYIGNSIGVFKTTDEGITWDEKISGLNPQKYIKEACGIKHGQCKIRVTYCRIIKKMRDGS